MDRRVSIAAALLGLGYSFSERRRMPEKTLFLLSTTAALTCFYTATSIEYINLLRGGKVRMASPGGALFLGGICSAGAAIGSILGLGLKMLKGRAGGNRLRVRRDIIE